MSDPAKLVAGTLPDQKWTSFQQLYQEMFRLGQITFPGGTLAYTISSTTPGASDRDKLWVKVDGSGNPIGHFVFSGSSWVWPHEIPANDKRYFRFSGLASELDTLDGGAAGTVTDTTGPFWEEVTGVSVGGSSASDLVQVVLSGSGNWTAPISGKVRVERWGGGGAGGSVSLTGAGYGGGSGAYASDELEVTANADYAYVVGGGGTSGGGSPAATTFGALDSVGPGGNANGQASTGAGGTVAITTSGLGVNGQRGTTLGAAGSAPRGGPGGQAGNASGGDADGYDGEFPGGGGGGGYRTAGAVRAGGDGAAGSIVITYVGGSSSSSLSEILIKRTARKYYVG